MKKLMLGNEAIALGAYEAGARVVSSYPGTPSTEITEYAAKYDEIYCEWAPNEKVAAETALGACIAGARAMTCCKHVGLNVMADPLFTASYTGINGGFVITVADDPGMYSSQNEQDSRHYAKAAKILMLEPSDSEECKEFTKIAFELSEKFDTPVFVRLTTRISHSQSLVEIGCRRGDELKTYEKKPEKYVMTPANAVKKHSDVENRLRDLAAFAETTALNTEELNGGDIGVITSGITYNYAKEAFGDKVSYFKLGMVYPMPVKRIKDFASKFKAVYVLEELDPFIEEHCKINGVKVVGKDAFTLLGEYSVNMLKETILGEKTESFANEPVPIRPPVMCAGCPHRGTFYVLKKLGLNVAGDIGCYTLGASAPLFSIDTTICMGASIGTAHGMAKARGKSFNKNLVSVIGDSTFIHSGITGLIDIVYNKGANTVIILDNSTTGMTGRQDNPTTGKTIKGEATKQVDLALLCRALGVESVKIADPFEVKEFERIVKEEIEKDEPSVIIAQRPCTLLKKIKYSGSCIIINDKCRNCKMCLKAGCPAIIIKNDKPFIDANQCCGCSLCVNICPFNAIEKEDK